MKKSKIKIEKGLDRRPKNITHGDMLRAGLLTRQVNFAEKVTWNWKKYFKMRLN